MAYAEYMINDHTLAEPLSVEYWLKYKTGEYDYDKSKRLIQLVKNGDQKVWKEEFEKGSISPKTVMKKT